MVEKIVEQMTIKEKVGQVKSTFIWLAMLSKS